ncbi:MAG: NUDIX hydrolase [Bacteroidia bacterium]|nr:NUDIX hydrolase [Bacteroidia bacterium]
MNRTQLLQELQSYQTSFVEEKGYINSFLHLLKDTDAFQRTHLPGHITGSAWIVNSDKTKALLVHHAKLNRWLQPGGHADGDENVLQVALREAEEETGLKQLSVLKNNIFDLDIHTIPNRKDFPEHLHYDIRFLVKADESEQIIVSEESHDVKWIQLSALESYNNETSIIRLKQKLL